MNGLDLAIIIILVFGLAIIAGKQEDIMDILKEMRDIDNKNNK